MTKTLDYNGRSYDTVDINSMASSSSSSSSFDHDECFSGLSVTSLSNHGDDDSCDDDDDDLDDQKENRVPTALPSRDNLNFLSLDNKYEKIALAATSPSSSRHNCNNDIGDDDDDLVEIFSRSSPLVHLPMDKRVVAFSTSTRSCGSSKSCVFDDDGDENAILEKENQPQLQTINKNSHYFDSLDMDALTELDENDSIHENENAATITNNETSNKLVPLTRTIGEDEENSNAIDDDMKNNYIITYNCEKKECATVDDDLIESSNEEENDDDIDIDDRSPRRMTLPSKASDVNSTLADDGIAISRPCSSKKSLSGSSSNSSLDTPRAIESPPPISSSPPRRVTILKNISNLPETSTTTTTSSPSRSIICTGKQTVNPYLSKKLRLEMDFSPKSVSTSVIYDVSEGCKSSDNPPGYILHSTDIDATTITSTITPHVVSLPDIGLNSDAQLSELKKFGIDYSHIAPPSYIAHPDPIVHKFNSQNRPPQSRRNISIDAVFTSPVNKLWKTSNKFHSFNHLQSEMVNIIANSDKNVIVSAPTGAGKTVLFEMAMARLISSNMHPRGGGAGGGRDGWTTISKARKILYLAPNKALCEERQLDWSKRFADINRNIVCTTITGGLNTTSSSTSYADIASSHVIITTTEKWDSITRRWNEQFVLLASIKLVLVDEVHMIGEPERGGCLESVICRMKTIQRVAESKMLTTLDIATSSYKYTNPSALASNMRIVAVSATLPNISHIASFIDSGEAFTFDQSYRPVPLNVFVQACGHIGNNRYLFDKSLNQHVPSILKRFSSGRPAIVFCHSKKETEELAGELSKAYVSLSTLNESSLINFSDMTETSSLHQCIRRGIAYHHAGLDASDRRLVEQAFGSSCISCLCATSTLAVGVNMPSHLVVVKGTSAYRGASEGHQDIDTGTLLQMIGRAGRPGFDTSGTAVIMTDTLSKTRYENMSQGLKVVESHLMDDNKLTEVLNIEISQGVITNIEDAVNWVKGTFLYRRIQIHPLFYGFNGNGDSALNTFIFDKCTESIEKLRKIHAIAMNDDDSTTFSPTPGCHVMSRNFIDFETMKGIIKLPHNSGPIHLLHMISNCSNIQTQVRRHEKKALNEAYKQIKYKLEGPQSKIRIQTPAEKTFVMLQAAIGRHYFDDFALRQQLSNIIDGASQVLSAIEQYAKEGCRNGHLATQGMLFRRSLFSSLWGENDGVLNQINGVSQEMASKLKDNGISTFADVLSYSSEDIENVCGVSVTFANSLRDAASTILQHTLKLSACSKYIDGELSLCATLTRKTSTEQTNAKIVSYSLIIFTDRLTDNLLHYSESISRGCEIIVPYPEKFGRAYFYLVSNLVGLDEHATVDGNDVIEKSPVCLSRLVSNSSTSNGTKLRKQCMIPPSSRKRSLEALGDSIINLSDPRLKKRGNVHDQADRCVLDYSNAVTTAPSSSVKNLVTPSPHPSTANTILGCINPALSGSHRSNIAKSPTKREETSHRFQAQPFTGYGSDNQRAITSERMKKCGPHYSRSSWFKEKNNQKTAQQTAFNSPKENPFSTYSFDPNNIEKSLDSNANRSIEQALIPSIIPNLTYFAEPSRNIQSFRTPGNRRKNIATSTRISSSSVLQQKAAELQQHHSQFIPLPVIYDDARNNSGYYTTHNDWRPTQIEPIPEIGFQNDLSAIPQGAFFHDRSGTSIGTIVGQSSSAPSYSQSLPPYNLSLFNNNGMPLQKTMRRGPMVGNQLPLLSSTQYHTPRMHTNNFNRAIHQASSQRHHVHDGQFQKHVPFRMHRNTGTYLEICPGLNQQPMYDNSFIDPFHGYDPRESSIDHNNAGTFYGSTAENIRIADHLSYDCVDEMGGNIFQGRSFDNRNVRMQPEFQSEISYMSLPNSHKHEHTRQYQMQIPVNPYKTNHRPVNDNNDMAGNDFPPLHEVVVQNNSVQSGLAGDDTSRFEDAFF